MFAIGDQDGWAGLSKLNEECGELIQIIGKLMGTHGILDHWDGSDLKIELEKEIADVLAAICFVVLHTSVNPDVINERADLKLRRFEQWHALGDKNQEAIRK